MRCELMLPTASHIQRRLHNKGDGSREIVRRWFVKRDGFRIVLFSLFEDSDAFFKRWSLLEWMVLGWQARLYGKSQCIQTCSESVCKGVECLVGNVAECRIGVISFAVWLQQGLYFHGICNLLCSRATLCVG